MTTAIERQSDISPYRSLRQGIGLMVVNLEGDIWTQIDASSHKGTGRKGGLPATIFESGKPGESHEDTIKGALAELVNNSTVAHVANHLYTTDSFRSTPTLLFDNPNAESIVAYTLAVVVFDGDKHTHFEPYDKNEVIPLGWYTVDDFLDQEVRPLSRDALTFLQRDRTIARVLDAYQDPKRRQKVIDSDFQIEKFYFERERQKDSVKQIVI